MKHLLSIFLLLSLTPVSLLTKTTSSTTKKTQAKKTTTKQEETTVITVDANNFDKLVLNAKTPVLLDVYAEWCNPCRNMSPIFEEVSKAHKGKKITFAKIKMDDFEKSEPHVKLLKEKLGVDISMIPTFLYIENGKLVEQIVGSQSAVNLSTKVASLMKKDIKPERNLA